MKDITDAANPHIADTRVITDPTIVITDLSITITTIHQHIGITRIIRIIRIILMEAITVFIHIAPIGIAVIIGITVENTVAIIVMAGLAQAAPSKIVTRITEKNVHGSTAADRIEC